MTHTKLEAKLLAAARAHPPSAQVPYAFEKRIMARLAESPRVDAWAWWAGSLWRAAAPCLAVMVLVGVWSWNSDFAGSGADSLDEDLETAVYAVIETPGDPW
jgi:hypothetical protein